MAFSKEKLLEVIKEKKLKLANGDAVCAKCSNKAQFLRNATLYCKEHNEALQKKKRTRLNQIKDEKRTLLEKGKGICELCSKKAKHIFETSALCDEHFKEINLKRKLAKMNKIQNGQAKCKLCNNKATGLFRKFYYCDLHKNEVINETKTTKRENQKKHRMLAKYKLHDGTGECSKCGEKAVKSIGSSLFCENHYRDALNDISLKKILAAKTMRERINKGEICCTLCDEKAVIYHDNRKPLCKEHNIKALELKKNKHNERLLKDENYRIRSEENKDRKTKIRKIEKDIALKNSTEICKIFQKYSKDKIHFNKTEINEPEVRLFIFETIANITGINTYNERPISLSTNTFKSIDVYIKDLKLFIEYKNTSKTQSRKEFDEEMREHIYWISSSRTYKNSRLISVSTDGSMGDYNICQFLEFIYFPAFQNKITKKAQTTLQKLIKELKSSNRFVQNVWPEIKTSIIIDSIKKENPDQIIKVKPFKVKIK